MLFSCQTHQYRRCRWKKKKKKKKEEECKFKKKPKVTYKQPSDIQSRHPPLPKYNREGTGSYYSIGSKVFVPPRYFYHFLRKILQNMLMIYVYSNFYHIH